MNKQQFIEKYKKLVDDIFEEKDIGRLHKKYDDFLELLLIELGYKEIIYRALELKYNKNIFFWYT